MQPASSGYLKGTAFGFAAASIWASWSVVTRLAVTTRLDASDIAAFGALVPALSALFAIPLLEEWPNGTDWVGMALISAGVYLASGGPLGCWRSRRCRDLAKLAEAHCAAAVEAIAACPGHQMRPAAVMLGLYRALLHELLARGWKHLEDPVRLPAWRKLALVLRHG
jgi:hypothetical protein